MYNTSTTKCTLYSTYRFHVQHSIHCAVCTDILYNTVYIVQYVQIMCVDYNGTAGDRPLLPETIIC